MDLSAASVGEQLLEEAAQRRRDASRRVRELNQRVEESNDSLVNAKSAQAEIATRVDDALEKQREAHAELLPRRLRFRMPIATGWVA